MVKAVEVGCRPELVTLLSRALAIAALGCRGEKRGGRGRAGWLGASAGGRAAIVLLFVLALCIQVWRRPLPSRVLTLAGA